jgi:hypothetical protein
MNIGDYVTVQDIKDQTAHRWVVLVDLVIDDDGDIDGGTIKYIEATKVKAGNKTAKLYDKGITSLLISGSTEGLCVGGVFAH